MNHHSRRRPTPALIVAVLALAAALTGTAYALQANSVTSKHIKNGTVKPVDLNPAVKAAWAHVDADGTLIRGSKGTTVAKLAPGLYAVKFARSVRNRGLAVTSGATTSAEGLFDDDFVAQRCGGGAGELAGCSPPAQYDNPRTVLVSTDVDSDSDREDAAFYLVATP